MIIAVALLLGADLSGHFQGIDGTFVLYDPSTNQRFGHNTLRARRRFSPCSTFKIPNAAIALETGVAKDLDFTLAYEPKLNVTREAWRKDQTLKSAYDVSAVWYFQEIARRVGLEPYEKFLRIFDYGNKDTSGGVDQFWLGNSLRISADEQVRFLERLHRHLGLADRTKRLMKQLMLAEETPLWKLYGKTGACRVPGEPVILWYVGYVEREGKAYYFALNMSDKDYEPLLDQRVPKAKAILKELRILD